MEEDFAALGIKGYSPVEQAKLGGIVLTEAKEDKSKVKDKKKCEKCEKDYNGDACACEDVEEDVVDPLDAPDVNDQLFDAIMGLPYESMSEEDVQEVIDALKEKTLPEDADDVLKTRAEEVVDHLINEVAAKKTRRHKAGSMGKKASFQCPEGTRKDPGDKTGRRCVRAAKAAGGAGKLAKESRKKTRWGKSGSGKKSARKSGRWAARREDINESSFARELNSLLEEHQEEQSSVRDEVLGRMSYIFELLHEEFLDEAVTRIFAEASDPIFAAWDSGRLDEDVMSEDEFMAEIKPMLTLITKSLDRIDRTESGELGNE
jgi:hypothetical protein